MNNTNKEKLHFCVARLGALMDTTLSGFPKAQEVAANIIIDINDVIVKEEWLEQLDKDAKEVFG